MAKAHKATAGSPLLRGSDCFLALDGRTPSNLPAMSADIAKATKACCPDLLPKRPITTVRLVHHTKELPIKSLTACSPDPMETMLCCFPKGYKLPTFKAVADSTIQMPDNRVRAWWNLGMKAGVCLQLNTLEVEKYRVFLQHPVTQPKAGDDGDESDEDDVVAEALGSGNCRLLFPWESPEEIYQQMYKAYGHQGQGHKIIDFHAGCGVAALAAARESAHYIGFCCSEAQRSYIQQFVILHIAVEVILDTNNGFRMKKRVLGKQGSLTGEVEPRVSVEPPAKKQASSSSSSSSD